VVRTINETRQADHFLDTNLDHAQLDSIYAEVTTADGKFG